LPINAAAAGVSHFDSLLQTLPLLQVPQLTV
jgi:hypothetical protein